MKLSKHWMLTTLLYTPIGVSAQDNQASDEAVPVENALSTYVPTDTINVATHIFDVAPREVTFDTYKAREQNSDPDRKWCHKYRESFVDSKGKKYTKDPFPGRGMDECNKLCGPVAVGIARSCGYMGFSEYIWAPDPALGPYIEKAVAPCNCDDKDAALVAKGLVKVFAIVGEVTCNVWVGVLTGFVDFFLNAALDTVDGVIKAVEAMGGMTDGHEKVIQGALAIKTAETDKSRGRSLFGRWIADKVCAKGALTIEQTNQIWDTITNVNDLVMSAVTLPVGGAGALNAFKFGGTLPKLTDDLRGSIDQIAKHDPPKDKVDNPIGSRDKPKTTKQDEKTTTTKKEEITAKTTAKTTTTTTGCKNKRGENGAACKKTTTIIRGSKVEHLATITKTCKDSEYTQACYHYYSAIKGGAKALFTCRDSNGGGRLKLEHPITSAYKKDHKAAWRDFAQIDRAKCHADEWPPVYFMPKEGKQQGEAQWQQRIRYLPDSDNTGAASHWRAFCAKNDGGEGNGQFLYKKVENVKRADSEPSDFDYSSQSTDSDDDDYEEASGDSSDSDSGGDTTKPKKKVPKIQDGINTKLVPIQKKHLKESKEGKDGIVTEVYTDVPYTRAVFSMTFAFTKTPTKENDWFLKENPCWPKDAAPLDPGFVLATDDNWYKTAALGPAAAVTRADYGKDKIPDETLKKANAAKVARIAQQVAENALGFKKAGRRAPVHDAWDLSRYNTTDLLVGRDVVVTQVDVPSPTPERTDAVPTAFITIRRAPAQAAEAAHVDSDLPIATGI